MSNIIDYVSWRGDLDFTASPFNEVDSLILTQLVYLDFRGIVPGIHSRSSVTLEKARNLLRNCYGCMQNLRSNCP